MEIKSPFYGSIICAHIFFKILYGFPYISIKNMEIYGNIWKYMEIYGNIWKKNGQKI
jgi:hypothetical protein